MRDLLTEEEIRELSKRAFLPNGTTYATQVRATLQRAARLGAERERERAARVCEQWADQHRIDANEREDENCDFRIAATDCAIAIRRGEEG